MSYRADKLMIDGHTDTQTHIHTHAGKDNTRRPKLASGKNTHKKKQKKNQEGSWNIVLSFRQLTEQTIDKLLSQLGFH